MDSCDVCSSRFRDKAAAQKHKKATGHCICNHCNKIVASSNGLEMHIRSVHIHKCPQCAEVFTHKELMKNHQKRSNHCYCGDCNRVFGDSSALASHLQSPRHSTDFRCCDCDRGFKSTGALEQHLRQKVHKKPSQRSARSQVPQHQSPHPCSKCSRNFTTPNALHMHLNSLAHRPLSNLPCIDTGSCKKQFSSPSALLHHLESGTCTSGMNRENLRNLAIEHDTDRLITKERSIHTTLMEVNHSLELGSPCRYTISDTESEVLALTPSSTLSQNCWTPETGSMTDWTVLISLSTNNRCPFCSPKRRPFGSVKALQDHLLSVAHETPFAFCPVGLTGGKAVSTQGPRGFTTLSGLAQHLESGACDEGIAGFKKAIRYLEKRLKAWGLSMPLTIKHSELGITQ